MIRWPWVSQEERDQSRWNTGRQGAQARGMRQAASRDLNASDWRPGPVPPARRVRRQARELTARQADPGNDLERARTLARATEQSLRGRSR